MQSVVIPSFKSVYLLRDNYNYVRFMPLNLIFLSLYITSLVSFSYVAEFLDSKNLPKNMCKNVELLPGFYVLSTNNLFCYKK